MSSLVVTIGDQRFAAEFERHIAPKTVAAFERHLPFSNSIIHVRWSGEAMWGPLGNFDYELEPEEATSFPAPGQMLLYPGGASETELILAYGPTCFASKAGQLAGNPLLRITDGLQVLTDIGRSLLWEGSRRVSIEAS